MVLFTFAETKVNRLPGRNPASIYTLNSLTVKKSFDRVVAYFLAFYFLSYLPCEHS